MTYRLFLDDERNPPDDGKPWIVCRSSSEALEFIFINGEPSFMSLDHDLAIDPFTNEPDTTMIFLKKWVNELWDGVSSPPEYRVHSQNPVGSLNIQAFLNTWKKSCV